MFLYHSLWITLYDITKTLLVNIEKFLTTEANVSTPTWETGVISHDLEEIELTFPHRVQRAEPLNERGRVTSVSATIVTGNIPKLRTGHVFHLQWNKYALYG